MGKVNEDDLVITVKKVDPVSKPLKPGCIEVLPTVYKIADRWKLNCRRRPTVKDVFEDIDKDCINKSEAHPVIRCNLSKHWRLLPGMLVVGKDGIPARVLMVEKGKAKLDTGLITIWAEASPEYYWPVLDDHAMIGCLLALVREVRGMCACYETVVGWRVYSAGGTVLSQGKTEGAALVSALEGED